ncbi:response regulator [Paenibacillus sp. GCM10012307]|uniref:Response regulator n=1 Tax=Paenibacillus roseus TaxID=2798579 RepID=A0A934MLW7_9BACL|nr:response regulator [Paenibacillus roseus]MBJ6362665.1 response regulator [Paenibacillus roseus]
MPLKLLVVEDEPSFRQGIINMVDWNDYGVQIMGEAENGREALECMLQEKPDLVLTDITMPVMNGLELISEAKVAGLDFYAVLLTGYDEFQYAQEAIKLGVEDYLLKPCMPQDILRVIMKIKQKKELEEQKGRRIDDLSHSWNKNIPLLKAQVLSGWIKLAPLPLEDRADMMQEFGIALGQQDGIQVGAVRLEQPRQKAANWSVQDAELFRYAALNITYESLKDVYVGRLETFVYQDDIVWVGGPLSHQGSSGGLRLSDGLQLVQSNLRRYLQHTASLAVSSASHNIMTLHLAYQEVSQAMSARFYRGRGGIYMYTESDAADPEQLLHDHPYLDQTEKNLLLQLQNESYEQSVDTLEEWLSYLRQNPHHTKEEVNLRASNLVWELQKWMRERYTASPDWPGDLVPADQLAKLETLDDVASVLQRTLQQIVGVLSQKVLHRTVQATLDLIKAKYATNLTLDSASKEVFVSNSYLSSLFKQELGINFLDYLHQYRVEKAKEYLRQQYKIYAVAKLVGYQEERHFSSTFKKWTGMTPTQYQKNYPVAH